MTERRDRANKPSFSLFHFLTMYYDEFGQWKLNGQRIAECNKWKGTTKRKKTRRENGLRMVEENEIRKAREGSEVKVWRRGDKARKEGGEGRGREWCRGGMGEKKRRREMMRKRGKGGRGFCTVR